LALPEPFLDGFRSHLGHELRAEGLPSRELIVRQAPQSNVVYGCGASSCDFDHMVVFELRTLFATMSRCADERASIAIALVDRSPHAGGDVTRIRRATTRPRSRGRSELTFLQRRDRELQRLLERCRDIAGGKLVGHEVLCALEQSSSFLIDHDVQEKALVGDRLDLPPRANSLWSEFAA